jgi:separase
LESEGFVEGPKTSASHISDSPLNGIEWQVSQGLLDTLYLLSKLYFYRGSPRESEYFAQQAQDLSSSLNLPLMTARALGLKAQISIAQGRLDLAQSTLLEASSLLSSNPNLTTVLVEKLMGDLRFKGAQISEADELYERAERTLSNLDDLFGSVDDIVRM